MLISIISLESIIMMMMNDSLMLVWALGRNESPFYLAVLDQLGFEDGIEGHSDADTACASIHT